MKKIIITAVVTLVIFTIVTYVFLLPNFIKEPDFIPDLGINVDKDLELNGRYVGYDIIYDTLNTIDNKYFHEHYKGNMLFDTKYFLPNTTDLEILLAEFNNDYAYTPISHDCNSFSSLFMTFSMQSVRKMMNDRYKEKKDIGKIAVGSLIFFYDGGGHALNIAIDSTQRIYIIEPQITTNNTNPYLYLTQEETEEAINEGDIRVYYYELDEYFNLFYFDRKPKIYLIIFM